MIKNILKKLLPFIFSKYIKFVYHTNKWTIVNDVKVKELWSENKTFIWMHWHGQSLMLPNNWSHNSQKLNALVSLHGDGELQEGQIWEAAMFASAHKVDNLISTIDYNGRQIDGDVDDVIPLGNIEDKWKAFGWQTLSCDGNNQEEIIQALNNAKKMTGKGKLTLTGQLGDVMKESALIALEYIKANAEDFNVSASLFENSNVHIPVSYTHLTLPTKA